MCMLAFRLLLRLTEPGLLHIQMNASRYSIILCRGLSYASWCVLYFFTGSMATTVSSSATLPIFSVVESSPLLCLHLFLRCMHKLIGSVSVSLHPSW